MNPDRTVFIFVNGILTMPGASDNWNGKAVTWTHLHTPFRAEKVEYLVRPIGRILGQRKRAEKLAKTLTFYAGWSIVLVGHSNGCDVILDALASLDWPRIEELHLVSAACEADFNENGLNKYPAAIGRVCVYVAGKDWALTLAKSQLGRLLGYGALGKTGPVNARRAPEVITRPEFGHGDWFTPTHLNDSMWDFVDGMMKNQPAALETQD